MTPPMRDVSRAAVNRWGIEDQMLMVAEEGIELSHAVLKWRRAYKHYNKKGVDLTRDEDETLMSKGRQRGLEKAVEHVRLEAMQVLFMLDQLQVMLPGDYESTLEGVINDCVQLLQKRGVEIWWLTIECFPS